MIGVSALLPFSPGMGEVLLILAMALLLFGADRLPEIARSLGRWLHSLRRASDTFQDYLLDSADPPMSGSRLESPDTAPRSGENCSPSGSSDQPRSSPSETSSGDSAGNEPERGERS